MKKSCRQRIASLVMVFVMLLSYIPGTVWAVDATTDIKAIEKPTGMIIVEDYDDYFGDKWLEKLGLPETVKVTLADGSTTNAAVTWDTSVLDTRTTGYYSVPGDVTLPAGATNGQNLKATITIQVREKKNLFANGDFETATNNGPTGWYMPGAGTRITTEFIRSGQTAGWARSSKATDVKRNGFNKEGVELPATVANRVNEFGAGQYYFGLYARKGQSNVVVTFDTLFTYRVGTQTSTPANQKLAGNKITLTTDYQASGNILELPDDLNFVQMQFNFYKTDTTVTFDDIGAYIDDAELIALKTELEVEPSAIAEIKTEILSRTVVQNYPDYVGEDWKAALGLPETVEVLTDTGATATVDVKWSYAGLDFTKYGKYTLVGKLDDSGFPNPKGLTVEQNIYVGKVKNLLPNPSFESDLVGWYLRGVNPSPSKVQKPVKDGSYAAMSGTWSASKIDESIADTRNMVEALTASVKELGGGQFYYSIWAQASVANSMSVQNRLYYRTDDGNGNLSSYIITKGNTVAFSNTEYVESAQVVDLPANTGWLNLYLYAMGQTVADLKGDPFYVDHAQFIALNVTIPKDQEPADVTEVLTKIPVRAVVKNYDSFVGANWQAALGLPETVEVRTSTGNSASVGVEWNYDNLKLDKEGKYTLVGTLDNSAYPNPKELSVTQVIYIRDYKNLITNPSFEGSFTGWYLRGANPSPSVTTAVSKLGKYAAQTGGMTTTKTVDSIADTRKMVDALDAGVTLQGGGQYYFSAWVQQANKTEGMRVQTRLNYKTRDEHGVLSSNIVKQGDWADLNNKSFSQTKGLIDLPANAEAVRLDLYVSGQKAEDLCSTTFYIDYAELIPLNVIVEQYEGHMVQVESVIPDRQIIQNYPEYIGESYTTADLMLPETVQVLTSVGQIVNVGVKWDYSKLDLTKTGTYTLYGTLEEMKIANPDALTVKQKIRVVGKQNIFVNDSFEDDMAGWDNANQVAIQAGIASPKRSGGYSLKLTVNRLNNYERNWIQAFYNSGVDTVGQKITKTGAGRYYYGGWVQGTTSSLDIEVHMRLYYRCLSTGDTPISVTSPNVKLSTKEFLHLGDIVELPDDIYSAHMDLYLLGTGAQMSLSEMYLEDFELIPLNVEVPNLTDIIDCEDVADVYVHEGSTIEGLKLPKALQVIIKNGQKFDLGVTWDTSSFDPNKIGEQTITGALNLGKTYKNPKNFVPTVKITIRKKGEELRQTIYISTSGSENNDGLSPESPKQDVKKIGTYLQQGYNVKLKRGDIWYIPTGGITLSQIRGTEDAPLTLGAYGSGELPIIGYLMKIENSAWKLVDANRNIYAADVSALGQRDGITVHRCFVNDEAYKFKNRTNYVSLKAGEYCSYNYTLYVRMPDGEKPSGVEVTPYSTGGTRLSINNVSYLNIEYIHFKGSSAYNTMILIDAPTEHLKWRYVSITHCFYYIMMWDSDDDRVHYKPEISNCFIDTMLNEAEGGENESPLKHWDVHSIEGITMRDGVDGAWIHDNHIRNVAHAFIAIESTERTSDYTTTGVRNCIIEDNLLEGVNAQYARAFNICGGFNLSGIQMCRDNTYRRNRCYDMTASSHLYGENNVIYSNLISHVHSPRDEDGNILDGKGSQPWGFDTVPWSDHSSVGNMVINNTFYNVSSAVGIYDQAHTVYNNLYANNLIVNWTSDAGANNNASGAFFDHSIDLQYVMNNGVFSSEGKIDHFIVDMEYFSAADVNNSKAGYSSNISGDPKFLNADLSQMVHGARIDFTLSNESPMRYTGLSLYDDVYKMFPAWERMKADYTDINGVVYLAESPSIGAWSFCEKIKGEVAEVGKLPDILARPGTLSIDQLNLPDAVPAVNDQGIDVMLLSEWNTEGVDFSKPGTITLTASLKNGPHTDLNINGKTASINIVVKDKLELLSVTTVLKKLTVLYGTSLEDVIKQLPQTLDVMEESGFKEALPVTWACNDYNPTKPNLYTFKCVLPEDMLTNAREFEIEVDVRLLHEIGRGMELLVNPDFIEGGSASPWKIGWGDGTLKITQDPQYVMPGEPSAAIVTVSRKYASVQQDVVGQMQLMGDGKYLFKVYMRAFEDGRPIDTSYPCLKVWGPNTYVVRPRSAANIGTGWVEFSAILDVTDVAQATEITFHTSTGKSDEDVEDDPKSYIISGCSLVYLGNTDAEVEATLDSIDLTWNSIKGENESEKNVMSDLKLPTSIGLSSKIKWTSGDESVITNDGKVTMGRVAKEVTLTATITYNGIETIKKFTVTVPRNPDLPTFSGSLSGSQTVKEGDEFKVTISLSSDKATSFNAYRFTLSFNTAMLEYVGISDAASTVTVDGGRVTIFGIGTERPITDAITVTFKAKKSGITEVKLVQVQMDMDSNASLDNLPTMIVADDAAVIDVQKADSEKNGGNTTGNADKDNSVVLWIVIGLVAAALIAGGVIALIVIKKKKQLPPATDE